MQLQIRISRLVRMDRLEWKWRLCVVLNAQLVVANELAALGTAAIRIVAAMVMEEVWRTNVKERAARRPPLTTTKSKVRGMG